MLNVGYIERV